MPAHEKAFEALRQRLRDTSDPEEINIILDTWNDLLTRVSEWDADQWGFDPDQWMGPERDEMEERVMKDAREQKPPKKKRPPPSSLSSDDES